MIAVVLAHQGGWDEMLLVLTPIAVFGFLLMVANRRAKAAQAARLQASDPEGRHEPGAGGAPAPDGAGGTGEPGGPTGG